MIAVALDTEPVNLQSLNLAWPDGDRQTAHDMEMVDFLLERGADPNIFGALRRIGGVITWHRAAPNLSQGQR